MVLGTMTQREIAGQINITEKTICTWKKNDEFMQEYEVMIRLGIKSLAAKAHKTQEQLLNSKNQMVRHLTAKDILDRAGFKHTDNVNIKGLAPVIVINESGLED